MGRLGYIPEMRLPHLSSFLPTLSSPSSAGMPATGPIRAALAIPVAKPLFIRAAGTAACLPLAIALVAASSSVARADSKVLLEPPPDRNGIAAITFDEAGAAVGHSSFEIEPLPGGQFKMTVRMGIEGGGGNLSEAILAPVYKPVPTMSPADEKSKIAPGGSAEATDPSEPRTPSVSSAPESPLATPLATPRENGAEPARKGLDPLDRLHQAPLAGLRIIEQRSQSTRADGTKFELLVIDHVKGEITCTPDGGGSGAGKTAALPAEDRVVNVPMQLFFQPLVRGEKDELRFQIAMCKDGPTVYEMIAVRGPRKSLGDREVLEIRYGPDFGKTIAFLASRLMPTFSFWFDAKTGGYLGHRMPLHRDGPQVTLVRAGVNPPTIGLDDWQ